MDSERTKFNFPRNKNFIISRARQGTATVAFPRTSPFNNWIFHIDFEITHPVDEISDDHRSWRIKSSIAVKPEGREQIESHANFVSWHKIIGPVPNALLNRTCSPGFSFDIRYTYNLFLHKSVSQLCPRGSLRPTQPSIPNPSPVAFQAHRFRSFSSGNFSTDHNLSWPIDGRVIIQRPPAGIHCERSCNTKRSPRYGEPVGNDLYK